MDDDSPGRITTDEVVQEAVRRVANELRKLVKKAALLDQLHDEEVFQAAVALRNLLSE